MNPDPYVLGASLICIRIR